MADAQSAPDSSSTVVTEANNVTPGATMETEAIEVTPVAPAVTVATDVIPDAAAVTVADDVVPDATPVPAVNGEAKVEPSESAAAEPVEETTKSSEVAVPTEANGATPVREDERKLFIGGMSSETTENDLKEYFSKFGEVENINVKLDPNTGRSRGFAFVIFKTVESVQKALAVSEHTISSKQVEVNRAKARPGKVFVGGLSPDVPEEEIREHFGKFGKILELELPFDKVRNQRKGFCFVTYEYGDCVKEVLKNPKQIIGDKEVEIKKATPRADMFGGGRGGMYGAPRGRGGAFPARGGRGRGGGGGGWGAQEWGIGYGGGYGGYGASAAGGGGYYEGGYGYQAGNAGGYGGGYGGGNYASQGQYGGQKPRGEGRGGQRYMPYNRQ